MSGFVWAVDAVDGVEPDSHARGAAAVEHGEDGLIGDAVADEFEADPGSTGDDARVTCGGVGGEGAGGDAFGGDARPEDAGFVGLR